MDRKFEERRIVHQPPWVEDAITTTKPKMTVVQSKLVYEPGRRLGYQGPRKVPHSPTPCEKSARWDKLNILQINIAGLQNKSDELLKLLKENDVQVALIQ